MRLRRILPNVVPKPLQLRHAPHRVIKTLVHPKRAASSHHPVDLPRGKPLPALQDARERASVMQTFLSARTSTGIAISWAARADRNVCITLRRCACIRTHQHMQVIWHHHEAVEVIPLLGEMVKRLHHHLPALQPSQPTRPMPLVCPPLQATFKLLVIRSLRISIPRLRMGMEKDFPLRLPLPQHVQRDRITQPPSHEVSAARLLTMRQSPPSLRELDHGVVRFKRQLHASKCDAGFPACNERLPAFFMPLGQS